MENCPQSLQKIYRKEIEQQLSITTVDILVWRKDNRGGKSIMYKLRTPESLHMLHDWYAVHCKFNHNEYATFYSKLLFCLDKKLIALLDPDAFFFLIADRRWLFLDYNDNYSLTEYPRLSDIVRNPNKYLQERDNSTEEDANRRWEEKAEQILQQVFIPTTGHKSGWKEWGVHLTELRNSYSLQKRLDKSYREEETIKIRIQLGSNTQDAIAERLCDLFYSYTEACSQYAYVEDLNQQLSSGKYREVIQCVWEYLKKEYSSDRTLQALILFYLFSQETRKVASGKIQGFTFKMLKSSEKKRQRAADVQSTVRNRIECNIKLFDYLLEFVLFHGNCNRSMHAKEQEADVLQSEKEISVLPQLIRAKYRFFRFARYDQYCHYDLRNMYYYDEHTKAEKLAINFACRENPKDGINLFGNLLRYHIRNCIPNQLQWLHRIPTRLAAEPILASLLLDEAQIMPTRERLTDRIRLVLQKSENRERILAEYKENLFDTERMKESLQEWCEQYNFYFRHIDSIYERKFEANSLENRTARMCGQIVLDYELREELICDAEENLLERAGILFGDLLNSPDKSMNDNH